MVRNILIAFCVILFVSCSKDTESKLFGKWQLQKVEASGNVQNVDTVYFNFEHSLFMYQVYVTEIDSFRHQYGYNTLEGEKTLLLELENDPRPISKFLPYTDWNSSKQTYTIDKLESKQLILSREGKTIRSGSSKVNKKCEPTLKLLVSQRKLISMLNRLRCIKLKKEEKSRDR